jgi:hypothetical protein
MSSRRRGFESGFIGEKKPINNDDYDEVFAGKAGKDPTGFEGIQRNKNGSSNTGFLGLDGDRRDDPNDYAALNFENDRNGSSDFMRRMPEEQKNNRKQFQSLKPAEKPLTHIDKDTVGKVVELKDKFQKMNDRTKDKERELQVLNMKIDALAERIKDIDK